MSTDPAPNAETAAVRAAMVRLAERWETGAANLVRAVADGASRHPSEVDTLLRCASELRGTTGAQSVGTDPAPDVSTTRPECIPHLMVSEVRSIQVPGSDDVDGYVDYRADTACGLDRDIALVTSDRDQAHCPACLASMTVDTLGHVVVGDPDPTHASWEDCDSEWRTPSGVILLCSRMPHPDRWQHIAGDGKQVLAVWTDEPQPDADS